MARRRTVPLAAAAALIVRQGDVALIRVTSLPANLTERKRDQGRVVLAYGEVTGHAHAIVEKGVVQFDAENATDAARQLLASVGLTVEVTEQSAPSFIEVPQDAAVVHEEHGTIPLPAGKYVKLQQREYSPVEIRTVAD